MTVDHPATFSDKHLAMIATLLRGTGAVDVLDPFAGIGTIHRLQDNGYRTVGVELEPEWANQHPHTLVGDATDLPFNDATFDAVATSPAYANRFADRFRTDATAHTVRSYAQQLGRDLTPGSGAAMHWGSDYQRLHVAAWREAFRVVRPGGFLVLNVSDHIRDKTVVRVSSWHCWAAGTVGWQWLTDAPIQTRRMRKGQNHEARVGHEDFFLFTKPGGPLGALPL